MGLLHLIPASEVHASYASETRSLLLRARGQAQKYTSDIAFHAEGIKVVVEPIPNRK